MPAFARALALPCAAAALAAGVVATAAPAGAATTATVRLAVGQRTIDYAHRDRLTVHLTDAAGPVRGATVSLWHRLSSHSSWQRLATLHTSADGSASLSQRMTRSQQVQARFTGDAGHTADRSGVASVTVRPKVTFGQRVVAEARAQRGKPYRYGAAGPGSFDCSGLTMYVFRHFHRSLPHNAAAQYDAVRHVARSNKRLGDLIFFRSGGGIYHVGIFAGSGRMWAAPHTGDHVRLESIYSSSYVVGRVH